MAKDLKSGLSSVFSSSKAEPEPKKEPEVKSSTKVGLSEEYDRETFIVRTDLMEQIKDVAYWDRKLLKEVVEEAFTNYVQAYLDRNKGVLKGRPEEAKARHKRKNASK